jgi:DNA-binding beta-propeller fold protein YncE
MTLAHVGDIDLPAHAKPGGFDHAAVHAARGLLYVAHTANDAVDVIDCVKGRYLSSIPGLTAVAGALVSEEDDLVFTSNRGEDTVAIFAPGAPGAAVKVEVGHKPNGLAYDPARGRLLAANVGDASRPGSFTVSLVDVASRTRIGDVPVAGRTRWTIFDAETDRFYVNIADPPQIAVVEASALSGPARTFPVPAAGPHGLELDARTRRLFCACDARVLVALDGGSGALLGQAELGGAPDVVFFNPDLRRLYVAIGDPGMIEVFDTDRLRRVERVLTERGAHTLAFDRARSTLYAFLPETCRAAVYRDGVASSSL